MNPSTTLERTPKTRAANAVSPTKIAFPWQLHAIWKLARRYKVITNDAIEAMRSSEFRFASRIQIDQLLSLSLKLGIFRQHSEGYRITPEGEAFSRAAHWRYWKPAASSATALKELGLQHSLLAGKLEDRPKIIDLFCGAGGLGLGFSMAGYRVAVGVDSDPQACEAHQMNFPDDKTLRGDIFKIAKDPVRFLCSDFGMKAGEIEGVVGGPPCQGFSTIGERVASDERNLLTSKFMDVVMGIRPKFFVMENVAGLLSSGVGLPLSTHFLRLAKPIGLPAAALAATLPDIRRALAKRQPQYKKRLISAIILKTKAAVRKDAKKQPELEKRISLALAALNRIGEAVLAKRFGVDCGDAIAKWNKSESIRVELAVAIAVEYSLARGLAEKNLEGELQRAAKAGGRSGAAIRRLLSEHASAPAAETHGDVKVGPILSHLIKRASKEYVVSTPTLLTASSFGAPQKRRRLFLVGIRKDLQHAFEFPRATHVLPDRNLNGVPAPTCFQALSDLPDADRFDELNDGDEIPAAHLSGATAYSGFMRFEELPEDDYSLPREGWNPFALDCNRRTFHSKEIIARISGVAGGAPESTSGRTRLKADGVSHTLRAGTREGKGSHTAVRPLHYKFHRVITVREGARLMGYPDWMYFHPTKWHGFRLVGNGVPSQLARAVARQIRRTLSAVKRP